MNTALDILREEEAHLQLESCENGHSLEKQKMTIIANNGNSGKKRNLMTL